MELHISIDRPRWLPRLSSRRRKLAAAVAVVALVGAPAGVLARDFTDVPPNSQNGQVVDKVSDAGIIRGCGDATRFCPDRNLTRLEMAQWFSRGGGSVASETRQPAGAVVGEATATTVMELDVAIPGISGFTQQVKIDADVVVRAPDANECPCEVTLYLQDETGTKVSPEHIVTLADPISDPTDLTLVRDHASVSLSLVADAPSNTEQTYFLAAQADAAYVADLRAWGELTAATYPFAN